MRRIKMFVINAVILTATSLLMRTIGVSFSVYISNKIGAAGVGLFQLIMSVYTFAITLASSGINLAATRLVSEELANGAEAGAKKAMKRCCAYGLLFGTSAAFLLFFGADFIGADLLRDARSVKSLKVLAVSLPFIAMSSAMSGYFTAVRRVVKSASAQVFEQFIRITVCIYGLNLLAPKGLEYACLAIVGGGSISEISSFCYLYLMYRHDRKRYRTAGKTGKALTGRMLGIALPVALSSYVRSALTTIEQLLVPSGLKKSGLSGENALAQYGVIQGMVMPVIMFPSAFLNAFSSLLVPELSECHERKNNKQINHIISRVFHVTLLFSIGVSGILISFPKELGMVIYNSTDASLFIKALAPLIMVMYLDNVVDGMLKGLNQQVSSMRYNIIDSLVSIAMVYFLLPVTGIGGYVAVIYVSELLNAFLSMNRLIHVTDFRVRFFDWAVKPIIAIFFASTAVRVSAFAFGTGLATDVPSVVLYLAVTVLLYILFLWMMSCITSDDLLMVKAVLK